MKVSINLATIKAVAHAVGKEETRYYLMGVHLEAGKDGFTAVATNGHMLLCAFQPYGELAPNGHFPDVIIPSALLAKIKLKRNADPWAELTVNGADILIDYQGEMFGGKAIDGTFPTWRNVVPRECNGETAQFNPEYLVTIQSAARVFYDNPKVLLNLIHNGESPALVKFHADLPGKFFGVVMPLRGAETLPDHAWCFDASPCVSELETVAA